ncbi:hypothetical protein E2C01_068277 [Portunus trituberculatus]|uniref:Uncharacterized protein n=1 Tax=Portunus trituberculatus TaxID=210409 RepID=A0A5B7HZL4_PORTR|nr:hypothetical protein [Portunus trituberculatus]
MLFSPEQSDMWATLYATVILGTTGVLAESPKTESVSKDQAASSWGSALVENIPTQEFTSTPNLTTEPTYSTIISDHRVLEPLLTPQPPTPLQPTSTPEPSTSTSPHPIVSSVR